MVPGDTNDASGIFVHDRQSGTTERVSTITSAGVQAKDESSSSSISADGRFVAFSSSDTNLAPGNASDQRQIYVKDRQTGTVEVVSKNAGGVLGNGESVRTSWTPVSSPSPATPAICPLLP